MVALPVRAILLPEERRLIPVAMNSMTITQLSRETGIHPDIIIMLHKRGVILPGEEPGLIDQTSARAIAEQLNSARRPVAGRAITVIEAEIRYDFSRNSIYRWEKLGWVKVLDLTDVGDRLFDEGDIAFARQLANLSGHRSGRPVFPPQPRSGRPRKKQI